MAFYGDVQVVIGLVVQGLLKSIVYGWRAWNRMDWVWLLVAMSTFVRLALSRNSLTGKCG